MKICMGAILLGACLTASAAGMSSTEFDDFRGQYQLADGRVLTMSAFGKRRIAEIDGIGQIEVVAIDDVTFVARHGPLKLTFERWPNGNVTGVSIEQ